MSRKHELCLRFLTGISIEHSKSIFPNNLQNNISIFNRFFVKSMFPELSGSEALGFVLNTVFNTKPKQNPNPKPQALIQNPE